MTPVAILSALAGHGVTVALLDDGVLRLSGRNAPPADLLGIVRAHKRDIVAALGARSPATPGAASCQPVDAGDHEERAAIESAARAVFGPPDPPDVHAAKVTALLRVASPFP